MVTSINKQINLHFERNIIKRIFCQRARVFCWFIAWLVAFCLPAIIGWSFSKFRWEKNLKSVELSFSILRDMGKEKRDTIKEQTYYLEDISNYINDELDNKRGPKDLIQKYELGDILHARYRAIGVRSLFGLILLLIPPLLLVYMSKNLLNAWHHSVFRGKYEPELAHILQHHCSWLDRFGLSKIQHDPSLPRSYYYTTLEIISAGYKTLYGTPKKDKIYLFLIGNLRKVKFLAEEHPNKAQLSQFYSLLNSLAKSDGNGTDAKYQVQRGLICKEEDFKDGFNEVDSWHHKKYPNINNVWIDLDNPHVAQWMTELNSDCDFAVFENANEAHPLFVGFYADRITFVMLDRLDKPGAREKLFEFTKKLYFSKEV